MDDIGALTILLQQRPSGGSSTWTTVKTFSYTTYTNMLGHNATYYGSNVSYSGISGYSYRAYVTVWAEEMARVDSRQILTDDSCCRKRQTHINRTAVDSHRMASTAVT